MNGGSEGSLSAPTLSGGDCKQVPLRSLPQTVLPGPKVFRLRLVSALLWHVVAASRSDRTYAAQNVVFKVKTGLNETHET